jgi:hypothetical protein
MTDGSARALLDDGRGCRSRLVEIHVEVVEMVEQRPKVLPVVQASHRYNATIEGLRLVEESRRLNR